MVIARCDGSRHVSNAAAALAGVRCNGCPASTEVCRTVRWCRCKNKACNRAMACDTDMDGKKQRGEGGEGTGQKEVRPARAGASCSRTSSAQPPPSLLHHPASQFAAASRKEKPWFARTAGGLLLARRHQAHQYKPLLSSLCSCFHKQHPPLLPAYNQLRLHRLLRSLLSPQPYPASIADRPQPPP